ncbi:DUF1648 domain-containing protein [candidate division CSSED10-310 bacterium]|uniref:DUF1648 domain-containing protein n=1 Tax=candidate division CSSED10-310 bacterium TaxID=2855610 RepID=A0ABV6Z0F9_UNCC1
MMNYKQTFMNHELMRFILISTFIANVALSLFSLLILPDKVAIHFGHHGRADNWASKELNALLFIFIDVLIFCLFYFTPRLIFTVPARWFNLPNRDFWFREENKPRLQSMMSSFFWQFGSALFLFFFGISVLTIQANLSTPVRLHEPVFFLGLILFMVYTIYWLIKFLLAFKIPENHGTTL